MLVTRVFLVVAVNQGLFPASRIQLMNRCAGGSIARQTAKLADGNIPYHKRHAPFMNGVGQEKNDIGFWVSGSFSNLFLARSQNFVWAVT